MQTWVTRVILRRQGSQWHWETSLFALLYTQQLACPQQHYASCMCVYPLCAVHCIMYEKKKVSQLWKKKQVIYCSLPIVQRLIISTERKVKAGWHDRSQPNSETQSGLFCCLKVKKKKEKDRRNPTSVLKCIFTERTVLSLDIYSCLLFCMMFSTQQPES